jgi:hypothetical protein
VSAQRRFVWLVIAGLAVATCTPAPAAPGATPTAAPTAIPTPAATLQPTATPIVPGDALLPNLVMEPLGQWHVELSDGRRLLRVTTVFSNYGDGPFELRGSRSSADEPTMLMDQVVYTASGGERVVPTTVEARYAGDGHDHWHAQRAVTMELNRVLDPGTIRFGRKIHFCFFDNYPTNRDLSAFDPEEVYLRAFCALRSSLSVRMGLSVGWGDRYGWDFPYQQIDITNMPGATYELRATVDYDNDFLELNDGDNCTMSRFQLPAFGEGEIITVEAENQPCPN